MAEADIPEKNKTIIFFTCNPGKYRELRGVSDHLEAKRLHFQDMCVMDLKKRSVKVLIGSQRVMLFARK